MLASVDSLMLSYTVGYQEWALLMWLYLRDKQYDL